MSRANQPNNRGAVEILAPEDKQLSQRPIVTGQQPNLRSTYAQNLFSDENLDRLSHLLDDCFRIPGTPVRFGLDGIIGFIPGLGDVVAGIASCILLVAAWFRGVPYVTLVRMLANVALEVTVGAIPILGNLFDIAWKANRRNYALMVRHLAQPHRHTWKDWAFLGILASGLLAILLTPVVVIVVILWQLRLIY